ncbi:MAG: hypothetical protein EOO01_06455 [Chitinophagaceae bacterium]|nr:MAG: hypothetical protein EOO01_06455 [Chitinophagaceae bacterium]
MNETVSTIEMKISSKERLKRNFMLIIDSYIKERERMGMMTSAKDRDEVAERARKQIDLL